MKKITNITVLLGLISYLISFFLPTLSLTNEIVLNGFTTCLINFGMLFFVENSLEYWQFIFYILPNILVPFLFVRYWRISANKVLTSIICLLSVISTVFWPFAFEDASVLLMGYWLWLIGVVLISAAILLKRKEA
ncbi:hypothetical protein N9M27_03140 [Flavobacteriales bacterium]|nr:hypothetical protein [Flavobacteriales bacterium]